MVDEIKISSRKEFFLKILIKQSKSANKVVEYTIHKGILYKKSFLKLLLCCIPLDMVLCPRKNSWGSMLWTSEVRTLTNRIIHQAYYWPTLRQDALNFVQKYKSDYSFGDVLWKYVKLFSWLHYLSVWGFTSYGHGPWNSIF